MRERDIFGQNIPAFNIKGKDKVKTAIGGFLSALIITVTFSYTIMQVHDMMLHRNPIISQNKITEYYGNDYNFDLRESN